MFSYMLLEKRKHVLLSKQDLAREMANRSVSNIWFRNEYQNAMNYEKQQKT